MKSTRFTHIAWIIFLVISLIAGNACHNSSPVSKELKLADSLLSTKPDSALLLLEKIDSITLSDPREAAMRTLLHIEARYKNYYDDTVETPIAEAAQYFRENNDHRNLMRALYYHGIILKNKRKNSDAIIHFMRALENADTTAKADLFYRANIYKAMSEVVKQIGNSPLSKSYAEKSWLLFKEIDSLVFIDQAQIWYASTLCENGQGKEAIKLMEEVKNRAIKNNDRFMTALSYQYLGNAYLWVKDYKNAIKAYENYFIFEDPESIGYREHLLYMMSLLDGKADKIKIDSMAHLISIKYGNDRIPHNYFTSSGDYKQAFFSLQHLHDTINGIYVSNNLNDANLSLKIYQDNLLNKSYLENRNVRNRNLWSSILFILLLLLISLLSFMIISNKTKKINSLIQTIGILTKNIAQYKNSDNEDKHTISNNDNKETLTSISPGSSDLLSQIFMRMDALYSAYYRSPEHDKTKKNLLSEMQSEINTLRESKSFLLSLESEINRITSGLLSEIYASLPRTIQERQRRLLAFLYFKLSVETLCLIFDIEPNALYKRKRRLLDTINQSSSSRKERLISCLSS